MKKIFFILMVYITTILTSCNNQDKNVINIGAVLSLTGNNAVQGKLAQNGILLAIDYINETGGINGKKLQIIIEDSETSAKGTINAFKKLRSANNVVAIISTGDTEFQAINPLAEQARIPVIATICTGMIEEGRSSWLFRYCFNEDQEDDCLMNFAKNDLNVQSMALLYPNTLFGQEFYKYSKKHIELNNINISSEVAYDFNSTDQKHNAIKIMNGNPDLICARGFGTALDALLRHIAEIGYKGAIIGDLSLSIPSTINNTGGIMEGAYIVASDLDINSEDKFIKQYVSMYKNKYKIKPCFWDAIGFDSCIFLAEAIRKGGVDATNIQDALYNLQSVNLLLGNNKFANKNDVSFDMYMFRMTNGNMVKIR